MAQISCRTVFVLTLFLLAVLVAAGLRLVDLGNRPMHQDEAVHAIKFGQLLEQHHYVYDPHEYHGPSLNFLTLPIARLASARKLTEMTERDLRLLPAIFGIALVGLVWLLRDQLGRVAALGAGLLTAVSPAMVFYSRYYIQEMLLVCFSFGAIVALWRYVGELRAAGAAAARDRRRQRMRQAFWLVMLGLGVGMMHATKETCVIALSAMAAAGAVSLAKKGRGTSFAERPSDWQRKFPTRFLTAGLVVLLTAAGVSALFFSSFLGNPRGVLDSFAAYPSYLLRASGQGQVGRHAGPWYHYFHLLFWWQRGRGPVWSEAPIAALALVGLAASALGKGLASTDRDLARFLGLYTVLMTVVYSALPYKTPWCALGWLHGMILLAGIGAAVLVRAAPRFVFKAAVVALLAAAAGQLAWQAWRASFVAYDDPGNPYVYAHTTRDVPALAKRIERIAAAQPDADAMPIDVICPDHDYWPLPWYLRRFRRVGWLDRVPHAAPAPLIITQPAMEPALRVHLYEDRPPDRRSLYMPVLPQRERKDWQLRPNVPLRMYVRLDLWEACRTR